MYILSYQTNSCSPARFTQVGADAIKVLAGPTLAQLVYQPPPEVSERWAVHWGFS